MAMTPFETRRLARIIGIAGALAFLVLTSGIAVARSGSSGDYVIRYDHWSDSDERDYGEFIQAIGDSGCTTTDACLHGPWNPFHASDPDDVHFYSDCAQLPYVLRAYFAWKRGLPFSFERDVVARGGATDTRYSREGNIITGRTDVLSGSIGGYALLNTVVRAISSASFRVHPDIDEPVPPDFYSVALQANSIRPGTVIYDPNGHVAVVTRVESDGRIQFIDGHPDNTITHEFYDLRFVRSEPGQGAGFKNWRPMRLVDYRTGPDGELLGGHIELARNADIPDFSDEQYYGNGPRPTDENWTSGTFTLNGESLDYYDYVRAKLAGGKLEFDPVKEIAEMVDSNCSDLHYRAQAVDIAIAAGIENRSEPPRLPTNIYGTSGDWETYSTPSRDARLKTAFKELRDKAERFVDMYERGDTKHLLYSGNDIVGDMLAVYDREAQKCSVSYTRTNGQQVTLPYEDARKRLFQISFDPYQCIELRWGATDPAELSSCPDGEIKRAWYDAEQNLRNQIDRTYDARMDFSLDELRTPGPGKGVPTPPDTDARNYLVSIQGKVAAPAVTAQAAAPVIVPDPTTRQQQQAEALAAWRAEREQQFEQWRQAACGEVAEASADPIAITPAGAQPCRADAPSSAPRAVGEIWDAAESPLMMVLPEGEFEMGSPPDEPGRKPNEGPQHHVEIPYTFAVSANLVTFNEWDACVAEGGCNGYMPSDAHWGRGQQPVVNVNWNDAQDYARWLSAKTGHTYRLLTESEWEYAARAGTSTPFYFGDTISVDQANYDPVDFPASYSAPGQYRGMPTPVGSFPANAFGLRDMSGNVWQWVQDCWNESYAAPHLPTQGQAWLSGDCERRVVRGGAFNNTPAYARSAFRFWEVGALRSALVGFRVARDL
jgi:formylglycine-generating enzyme required for sulfatase activity